MGTFFINIIFCNKKIRFGILKIGKDKIVSEYRLNEMLLNNNKQNHVMRLYDYNIILIIIH